MAPSAGQLSKEIYLRLMLLINQHGLEASALETDVYSSHCALLAVWLCVLGIQKKKAVITGVYILARFAARPMFPWVSSPHSPSLVLPQGARSMPAAVLVYG